MAEPIKISTSKYTKAGKVSIDGHIWSVKLPGAGTELRLNQAQRRLALLDKKVEAGTATEEDLDQYDKHEQTLYDIFKSLFQDMTKDNSEVTKWIEETPMAVIVLALEEIKSSANGPADTTTSS